MNRRKKERFKTVILAVLILTSLFQVGILWGHQNHGFPINFLQAFLAKEEKTQEALDKEARADIFKPFLISIYDNENDYAWKVPYAEDAYQRLWNEAVYYLREIALASDLEQLDISMWDNIFKERAYIFVFSSPVDARLARWFIDSGGAGEFRLDDVYKVALLPGTGVNKNSILVYVMGEDRLFRTALLLNKDGMGVNDYNQLFSNGVGNKRFERYDFFNVTNYEVLQGMNNIDIDPDVLIKMGNAQKEFSPVTSVVPLEIGDMNLIARILLGDERESYDWNESDSKRMTFQNQSNIYRIYPIEGLVEYKYTRSYDMNEKGSIVDAFRNAYDMVESIKKELDLNIGIYLHGVEESASYYRFIFNYKLDDYPVLFINESKVDNGFTIESNAERVISSRIYIRRMRPGNESKLYSTGVTSFMDRLFTPEMLTKRLSITSIVEGYMASGTHQSETVPGWIVNTRDGNGGQYMFSLPEVGGK